MMKRTSATTCLLSTTTRNQPSSRICPVGRNINRPLRNWNCLQKDELIVESTSSHPDIPEFMQVQRNQRLLVNTSSTAGSDVAQETEIRSKMHSSEEPAKPKHKVMGDTTDSNGTRSASVRVQNPPDVKFKRSVSTNGSSLAILANAETPPATKFSFQLVPRPFIMSVRMSADHEETFHNALLACDRNVGSSVAAERREGTSE